MFKRIREAFADLKRIADTLEEHKECIVVEAKMLGMDAENQDRSARLLGPVYREQAFMALLVKHGMVEAEVMQDG